MGGCVATALSLSPKQVDQKRGLGAAGNAAACVEYRCELSTAGAVTRMLQAALPCLLFLPSAALTTYFERWELRTYVLRQHCGPLLQMQ